MNTYYVTVGQRYAHEEHPLGLHPDGWLEIVARNGAEAIDIVTRACGSKWANLYTSEDFAISKALYKKGCLATLSPRGRAPSSK